MRLLAVALALLIFAAPPALAKKVALVIGNGAYTGAPPLANAVRDARDTAARLREIGFEVIDGYDLSREAILTRVQEFARRTERRDTALFYYAGHGVQLGRENHLIPVDGAFDDADALAAGSVRLQSVLSTMELRADTRIVILDACRDNPFAEAVASRSAGAPSRGLARVDAGVGSFIAFSTEPGAVASDGAGENSPFTAALLKHVGAEGADIHAVMRKVRADVVRATGGRQTPWENSSLLREVFLAGPEAPAASPEPSAPAVAIAPPAAEERHHVASLAGSGDDFLALRTLPTADGRLMARMPEGTPLSVLGRQGAWLRVRLDDGREGWSHGRWVECCRPAARGAPVPEPARHFVGGLDPGDFLSLRAAPDSDARLLAKLHEDEPLSLLAQRGAWLQVRLDDGRTGWAHGRWVLCCRDEGARGNAPAEPARMVHYVDGLDADGDNFLALRTEPSSRSGRRIDRMPPGTELEVLGRSGAWLNVRLEDGRSGWAHGKWIRCCREAGAAAPEAPEPSATTSRSSRGSRSEAAAAPNCDDLWTARNAIWHRHKYCFGGARGQRVFGNAGCFRNQAEARAAMSSSEAAEVDRLAAQERAQGCR